MDYTTYAREGTYVLPMYYEEYTHFDNKDVLNERFSFVLIENGSGILHINDSSIAYIAPIIFCINETEHIIIDDAKIKVIFFHPSIINSAFDFDNIRNIPAGASITYCQDAFSSNCFTQRNTNTPYYSSIGPVTLNRFDTLFSQFKEELNQIRPNWPCRSRSYIMELLFGLDQIIHEDNLLDMVTLADENQEVASVLTYLNNNYNKKISIADLTEEFSINRTTLSKQFNDYVGESIITYLNKLRISMASIILRDTKLPVTEVMERVGFTDSTHFLRTFKKYMQLTPTEYRDCYCWMN